MGQPAAFPKHGVGEPMSINTPQRLKSFYRKLAKREETSVSKIVVRILLNAAVQRGYKS